MTSRNVASEPSCMYGACRVTSRRVGVLNRHLRVAEGPREVTRVAWRARDGTDHRGVGAAHLGRTGNRFERLCFERARTAVPEEGAYRRILEAAPPVRDCQIDDRRNLSSACCAIDSSGHGRGLRERMGGLVAAGAGDRAVARQALVEEQPAAETHPLGRRRNGQRTEIDVDAERWRTYWPQRVLRLPPSGVRWERRAAAGGEPRQGEDKRRGNESHAPLDAAPERVVSEEIGRAHV